MDTPATQSMQPTEPISTASWEAMFSLGGEMGALMRSVDWASTPIGPIETWPQSLRTAVSICLNSRFPMIVWWGPELTLLYNDGYRPMLGAKHPRSMGQPGLECWAEIRDIIDPMLQNVRTTGKATWSEDQFLPLERNGFVEECYFTFSYSPIFDESGGVGGVFTAVTETTGRVLGERRMRLLRELAASASQTRSVEEACALATRTLAQATADLPFALLYLLDDTGARARLCGDCGLIFQDQPMRASAEVVELGGTDSAVWPLEQVARSGKPVYLPRVSERLRAFGASCGVEPNAALILPVIQPGQERPYGVLVAGISSHLALDDAYRGYFELVAGHLATAITNARAYEEERRRAEALTEIDRAKTAFFSNVSHEFRTPLTLLLGPLEDLRAEPGGFTPHQRDQLDLIHRNGLRLLKLVNTLLDFSRIEAGRMQAFYTPVDLAAFTAELASTFRSLVERAGLSLVVDCPPLPAAYYVDADMWEKIVLNLLSNAFKFTFDGEIVISLRAEGERAVLRVRDTGIGISAADLPHLFERFHRVHGAKSRSYEGSGIGLALVQELVRLHGGDIAVTSEPGAGTTFTVSLPAGASHLPADRVGPQRPAVSSAVNAAPYVEEASRWLSPAGETPAAADSAPDPYVAPPVLTDLLAAGASASRGQTGPAEVLIADDNADMRDYLSRLLSSAWRVRVVANGAEALTAARERIPDLILSDVMMPEMDGLRLVRELRADARTRTIPILLLSARAGQEAAIEGLEAGADDYLVKPFSAREVVARVASHLELARLRRMTDEQAAQLSVTFQAMTDPIFVFDAHSVLTQTNAAGRTLLQTRAFPPFDGEAPSMSPGGSALRDEHGRSLACEEWPRWRILAGQALTGPDAMDVLVDRRDGGEIQLNLTGAPVRDPSGRIAGGILVCRDVTERRRLERRTHEALRALLDMAATLAVGQTPPDAGASGGAGSAEGAAEPESTPSAGAPVLDSTQRAVREVLALSQRVLGGRSCGCVLADPATGALRPLAVAGSSAEIERRWWRGMADKNLSDYFPDDIRERLYAEEAVAFDLAGEPHRAGEGSFGPTAVLIVPVRLDAQRLLLLTVEGPDRETFTARERELAQAAARLTSLVVERERLLRERAVAEASVLALRESNRRMDEFLGIASHELRTPLTSITANVQYSRKQVRRFVGGSTATSQEEAIALLRRLEPLLDRSDRQLARLDRLVGDLLDVSRIQSGKLTLEQAPADLCDIVRDCVEGQRASSPDRAITLALPRRCPVPIVADADRIGQVITNYLTNALRYSPPGAPIAVHLLVQDKCVRVEVRDEGIGILQEEQQRIWERFHRVPGIERQGGSGVGLGLGLYLCASIVERHGGQVGVESAPGKGSTFWFALPLSEPDAAGAT